MSLFQDVFYLHTVRKLSILLLTLGVMTIITALKTAEDWLYVNPKSGDSIYTLLKRYRIGDSCSKALFLEYNKLESTSSLFLDKSYKLPIKIESYDGKSIRTSINITDYEKAKAIQEYNLLVYKNKVRDADYRKNRVLWVPQYILECNTEEIKIKEKSDKKEVLTIPLFGNGNEKVTIKSKELEGNVYYLVSGHGGPDPGAVTTHRGNSMCEDEYAYDVTIRLAKNLLERGAIVYMIIRDENDGIREDKYLVCDKDEVCYPSLKIPYNQVKRLRQRAGTVNVLYNKHKKTAKKQRCIVIHVDSRSEKEQIDVFFYHCKGSKTGEKLANGIRNTFEDKYKKHQRGRGYTGEVSHRNLYMLTQTLPVTCYIELGNIHHERDRRRVELNDNRQSLADWLSDALVAE